MGIRPDLVEHVPIVQLSIRYYVLSLDERTSRLYEGFRGTLIDIQNTHFPFQLTPHPDAGRRPSSAASAHQAFMKETDDHFTHYFAQDPLHVVIVGSRESLSTFKSITIHSEIFIGELEGDYTAVSPHDLGRIVWPIVKHVLAGSNDQSLQELERAARTDGIIAGFDAVSQSVSSTTVLSLFVEEGFRMKGSIHVTKDGVVLSPDVDVAELIDDAVDALVEKVLAKGGDVVFVDSDTMLKFQRIALIRRN